MKRCVALILMLLTLFGCGASAPGEPENPLPENLQVRELPEDTDFGGFTASVPGGEAEQIRTMVETVLSQYPMGLLEQLGPVEILLVGNLTGGDRFSGGSYAGFTQKTQAGWRVVLDVEACHTGTVHHELGHVLDAILTAAGHLTEQDWTRLNPTGFRYGSRDWEAYSAFFVDAYAMTDLTEDRAAVFEAAVMGGHGVFDGKSPLRLKLHAFSQAIRAHFDTEGWPAVTIWEVALQ